MPSLLAGILGIVAAGAFPTVLSTPAIALALFVALAFALTRQARPFVFGLLGLAWSSVWLTNALDARLPDTWHGQETLADGEIVALPEGDTPIRRFAFSTSSPDQLAGRTLRLSAYRSKFDARPGDRCRVLIRIESQTGFGNPSGLDYRRWLLARGFAGTAWVVDGPLNQCARTPELAPTLWIEQSRFAAAARLAQLHLRRSAELRGLLLGDGSLIDRNVWDMLRQTGTVHLIVISGMHVSLIFVLLTQLFEWLLVPLWLSRRLGACISRRASAMFLALPALVLYGLFTGLGLATLRALVMLIIVALAQALRRRLSFFRLLCACGGGVLALHPLAWLDVGFWLSMISTAALISSAGRGDHPMSAWLRAQVWTSLTTMPILIAAFASVPLAAIVTNLWLAPIVGAVVVPLGNIGLLATQLEVSEMPLQVADRVLDVGLQALAWVAPMAASLQVSLFGAATLAAVACVCLLALRHSAFHWLAVPLLGISLLPSLRPAIGEFAVTIVDVGQGSAALIRTHAHDLVIDTGPAAGGASGPLVQELQRRRIRVIDWLVVSHKDQDHAGQVEALMKQFVVRRVMSPAPDDRFADHWVPCRAGQHLRVDGVDLVVFWPQITAPTLEKSASENDRSCVVFVRARSGSSALFPGDITAKVEARITGALSALGPVDLVLVPHHGSATSSSNAFVAAAAPRVAVFSVGRHNRFGHPHPLVVARYQRAASRTLSTSESGAIDWSSVDRQVATQGCQDWPWMWQVPACAQAH